MNAIDFRQKYGVNLDSAACNFYELYVTRVGYDIPLSKAVKLWNPVKVLRMIRDLPITTIRKDRGELFNQIKDLIVLLEDRIEEVRVTKPNYYKYQIKPLLDGSKRI